MRIAQISPLFESVPPKMYGGTERVVSYLTEELVSRGHEVTLFASGDSVTKAELIPGAETALRLDPKIENPGPYHVLLMELVMRHAARFDVLHFHTEFIQFPVIRDFAWRTVTTLHGRADLPDQPKFYETFMEAPLVSISRDQRSQSPNWNWVGTVHNGLPRDLLKFSDAGRDGYLAFLGRISPEKGPEIAIEIARRAGLPLKIAAKIDVVDKPYWDAVVAPLVNSVPGVEYVGEITETEKAEFLGKARALIFPIRWPEPFGLVMIEAFACGTPVIAFPNGAVPEVIEEGVTGFVVRDVDQAAAAVGKLGSIDRARVRQEFERRFTAAQMADGYERIYRKLLERSAALRVVSSR